MEGFRGYQLGVGSSFMKKKRSATCRKPRPDSQFLVEGYDAYSHSEMPSLDNGSKLSPEQVYAPMVASGNNNEAMGSSRKIRREDRKYGDVSGFYGVGSDSKRSNEGVLAPVNYRSSGSVEGGGSGTSENKLRKLRLKVGGVTRTFHPNTRLENDDNSYNVNPSGSGDASRYQQKLVTQDNSDDDHSPAGKEDDSHGRLFEEGSYRKQMCSAESIRKSKRVPKRRVLDDALDERDEDAEIKYLEKLKTPKFNTTNNPTLNDGEDNIRKKNIIKLSKSKKARYDVDEDYGSLRSAKENRKKLRVGREYGEMDYVEEEEPASDDGTDPRKKKQKKESLDILIDVRNEPLTTRQRALQSGKSASPGESLIEFPNGLPPAPSRKQKEKLSEVEQQAKKAEAAQRRKLQNEKAAKESEAEAIRKILGQDSNRKKKEDKMKRERDEMAQKKAAESLVLASNSIRWVMGPAGTVVTFGDDVGLPSIFEPKTSSYPPPREKCAGPSCPNPYKYRDSKLNLPLCSLQCYRAVRGGSQTVPTC